MQRLHGISEVYRKWDLAWAIASCIRVDSPGKCAIMSFHEVVHSLEPKTELGTSSSIIIGTNDLETEGRIHESGFSECIPTGNAYNSFITTTGTKTNVADVPPLIRHSPTSWPGLYTALKRAQNISVMVVGEDKPTVMTLDLQLYRKPRSLCQKKI